MCSSGRESRHPAGPHGLQAPGSWEGKQRAWPSLPWSYQPGSFQLRSIGTLRNPSYALAQHLPCLLLQTEHQWSHFFYLACYIFFLCYKFWIKDSTLQQWNSSDLAPAQRKAFLVRCCMQVTPSQVYCRGCGAEGCFSPCCQQLNLEDRGQSI